MSEYEAHAKLMRNTICDAMVRLLDRKPFPQITVGNILEEAQIQRATFYRYFQDKYEVANTINQHLSEYLISCMFLEYEGAPRHDQEAPQIFDLQYRGVLKQMLTFRLESVDLCKTLLDTFRQHFQRIFPDSSSFESYLAGQNFISIIFWVIETGAPITELRNRFISKDHIMLMARYYRVAPNALLDFLTGEKA